MKIVIITGEESGDNLAASLVEALKKIYSQKIDLYGIGGKSLEEQGLKKIYDISEINVMGIIEVIPKILHIKKIINNTVNKVIDFNPDVVLTVDSPDFTLRIARKLKLRKKLLKIIHFVAPSVWLWRPGRVKIVKQSVDRLLTILPFEKNIFDKSNINTTFVGHPITEIDLHDFSESTLSDLSPDIKKPLLLVMPGSRRKEVEKLLPPYLESIRKAKRHNYFDIIIPSTENMHGLIKDICSTQFPDIQVTIINDNRKKFQAFYLADYAITTSGTAALELSYFGVTYVSGYKLNFLTYFLLRHIFKIRFGNLINIILKKMLIPELIQSDCNPDKINYHMDKLINDSVYRKKILTQTKKAIDSLNSGKNPSELAAGEVLKLYQS
jgi:lipid-A-disaccharide synthase